MVKNGFDVWLGNNRGNKYSRKHINPDITKKEFYDFSFQELGQYDVRAFYNKIHSEIREKKDVIYLGHSQGTTEMFVALLDPISRDYLSQYTSHVFQLAPVAYLTHFDISYIKAEAKYWKTALAGFDLAGIYEAMPAGCINGSPFIPFAEMTCKKLGIFCGFFFDTIGITLGFDAKYDDVYGAIKAPFHEPSGTSTKGFAHYAQHMIGDGPDHTPIYRRYDFVNDEENMRKYGNKVPPSWNFKDWPQNVKLHLLGGTKDVFATKPDVDKMSAELKASGIDFTQDWFENWDHDTFVIPAQPDQMFNVVSRELGL